jgi:hypothetical protein
MGSPETERRREPLRVMENVLERGERHPRPSG